jgi:hypothetical protein
MRGGAGFKRERGREHEDGKKVIEYRVEGAVRSCSRICGEHTYVRCKRHFIAAPPASREVVGGRCEVARLRDSQKAKAL